MGLKDEYEREGYLILPGLLGASADQLEKATERVISKTRNGEWQKRRTVGKQFPPYDNDSPDSWGVQHLMDPDLGEPIFAKWYGSPAVLDVVKELMGCQDEHLQLELFNLLINPLSKQFALRWHRDDVKETATAEEELLELAIPHYGVQWNTALYDDSCLYIVPRTHRFPRTPEQRTQSYTREPPEDPLAMPGAIQVHLKAGDTVFYNNNILHCATYSPVNKRATLHACIGDTRGGSKRARNILQHDLQWMKGAAFRKSLDNEPHMIPMLDRLLDMAERAGDKLVYSQSA